MKIDALRCRQREELLYQLKVVQTPPASGKPSASDSPWILVDSDGEEDEDPTNSWSQLQENDLVMLLNQFPLHYIFNHVLGGGVNDNDGQCVSCSCTATVQLYRPDTGIWNTAVSKYVAKRVKCLKYRNMSITPLRSATVQNKGAFLFFSS